MKNELIEGIINGIIIGGIINILLNTIKIKESINEYKTEIYLLRKEIAKINK